MRVFSLLSAALLILFFGSAQSAKDSAAKNTQAAIAAAFAHPAFDDFAAPDSVIVAQHIRQYVVVSVYQPCAWKKICKDGTLQIVFDPAAQKVVLVVSPG